MYNHEFVEQRVREGWRIINSARARKLRKRGENVQFGYCLGCPANRTAIYIWKPKDTQNDQ